MELLAPEMLDEGTVASLQKAMYQDLRIAARKLKGKPIWFVVVGDLVLKNKKRFWLFVALKKETEAKEWVLKLKGRKPKVLTMGSCTLESKDGKNFKIDLGKMRGNRAMTLKSARLAFKPFKLVQFADALVTDDAKADGKSEGGVSQLDPPTVDKAAAALKVNSARLKFMIADAGFTDADMVEVNKLLADPGSLEAEAAKLAEQILQRRR